MPFVRLFTCSQKHQNGSIFVDIESFRPCLSKPSYTAPKWALMVRLMQKERLKSPRKSLVIENQAFGGHLGHFGPNPHLGHFCQPFPSQGGHADKKPHLGSCLNQQDRATCGFVRVRSHGKPGKKKKRATGGGVAEEGTVCLAPGMGVLFYNRPCRGRAGAARKCAAPSPTALVERGGRKAFVWCTLDLPTQMIVM